MKKSLKVLSIVLVSLFLFTNVALAVVEPVGLFLSTNIAGTVVDPVVQALHDAIVADQDNIVAFMNLFGSDPLNPDATYWAILGGTVARGDYPGPDNFIIMLLDADNLNTALQAADAGLKADFLNIYGTAVSTPAYGDPSYIETLFGIVGGNPGFDSTGFLVALEKVSLLHNALETGDLRDEFETLFGIPEDDQRDITSDGYPQYLGTLFGIVGSGIYDQAVFLSALPAVASLHAQLGITPGLREDFETVFGIPVGDQDPPTQGYVEELFGIVGDGEYDQTKFLSALPDVVDLDHELGAQTLRGAFETLFGIEEGDQNFDNNDYSHLLFGIVGSGIYDEEGFLGAILSAESLHVAISADPNLIDDFAVVYGIEDTDQIPGNQQYIETLFGIVGTVGYIQSDFLTALPKVVSLDAALDSQSLRDDFATLFGIAVTTTAQDFSDHDYAALLFGIVGDPEYVEAEFLGALPDAASLHVALGVNDLRDEFEAVFGVVVANQVPGNQEYIEELFDTVGYDQYDETEFLTYLPMVANFDAQLESQGLRDAFETLFGIAVVDQNFENHDYADLLFGIVGSVIYDETGFFAALPGVSSLHTALGTNDLRDEFEIVFGVSVADQLDAEQVYVETLFGIVGGGGYNESDFLAALPQAASLHINLDGHRDAFEAVFGITVANQDPVANPTYRGTLFGIVGTPGYSEVNFLWDLDTTYSLYNALNGLRDDFETMFNIPVAQQVLTNGTYKQLLSSIVWGPGFNESTFTAALPEAASLHRALTGREQAFEDRYGITPDPTDGPITNVAYRTKLFDLIGDPFYNEAAFLAGLWPVREYDGQDRVIKTTYVTGDFVITEYNDVDGTKQEVYFGGAWVWQKTVK
ncbi:MAG: hypothetical protein HQ579_09710, partial [Candidatus Omnitrophica bacterium]|nr:hypothetical protein [Candidatus Omnitrophota bacterium]